MPLLLEGEGYMFLNTIIHGDVVDKIKDIPDNYINTIVTSPPYYGLRDYGVDGQIGLEESPEEYIIKMVQVFRECKRILKDDGTLWLNIGDSYWSGKNRNGYEWDKNKGKSKDYMLRPGGENPFDYKRKDLMGMPWRLAFALQADGWYLRSDIIWNKPNCMPESAKDRPTKSHEYIFLLSKSERYYYDFEAIREERVQTKYDHNYSFRNQSYIDGDIDNSTIGLKSNGVGFGHGTDKDYRNRERVAGSKGASGPKQSRNRYKSPDGWDTSKGSHGTIHRTGREKGEGKEYIDDGKRNKRTVWTVATQPSKEAHFATFPEKLIEPCILAGSPENGIVFDPFMGSGTVAYKSIELGRNYIGIEINADYIKLIDNKLSSVQIKMTF
jgi:site-specific DNA-methyltransferase (adenine-specific)